MLSCGKKADMMFWRIRNRMVNNTESIVMPWYKSVVESHLECCMCFWLPSFKKDTAELGRIQRKAMQIINKLETSYKIIRKDEKNHLASKRNRPSMTNVHYEEIWRKQIKVFLLLASCHKKKVINWHENIRNLKTKKEILNIQHIISLYIA